MLAWWRRLAGRIGRARRDRAAREADRLAALYKGAQRERPAEPDPLEELARLVGEQKPHEREPPRASFRDSRRRLLRRNLAGRQFGKPQDRVAVALARPAQRGHAIDGGPLNPNQPLAPSRSIAVHRPLS
jgi:hypothetical protein